MSNNISISPQRQTLIVYIVLTIVTLAVFWQVNQFDFINFDDNVYVTQNSHIHSGLTPEGVRWAFSTQYLGLWNPLVWLSFMFDYQIYGFNAGGYHLTNRVLHLLSTLLLFWLFNRMTGAVWKSAFVAAIFAFHPLHVESVAWISERKDVLSAFFWMLTLCLYVYYTEKPVIIRYLLVLFSFVCALMSKPMVVTLPVIMIILDYWPLERFQSKKGKLILWQLKEKIPFFILSAALVIITLHSPQNTALRTLYNIFGQPKEFPLFSRIANALVSYVTYLEKTFWPHDMAIFYPFPSQIPVWQVIGASLLILIITTAVIVMIKRLPYLFTGWLWYAITIVPVIGIIQISITAPYAMADRYHYLPSIGLAVMMAWGIPTLIKSEEIRKKLLFPAGIIFLAIISFLSWNQCGYWKNDIILFSHTLKVTDYNWLAYNNRGVAYNSLGNYKQAIEDYGRAIEIKPFYANAYNNRSVAYNSLGSYRQAIEDCDRAIAIKPGYAEAYINRGAAYKGLRNYGQAIEDLNRAIEIKPSYYAEAYIIRGVVYLGQGDNISGCRDARNACKLGNCKLLEATNTRGLCR